MNRVILSREDGEGPSVARAPRILRFAQDDILADLKDRVVIASFLEPAEAESAQRALAALNIAAQVDVRDDSIPRRCADVFPKGYDVIVGEGHAGAAIAELQKLWPDEDAAAPPVCPACNSIDIARLPRARIFFVSTVLFVIAGSLLDVAPLFVVMIAVMAGLLAITPPWRCRACSERWR